MRVFYKEDGVDIPAIQFVESQPAGYTEIVDEEELKRLFIGLYVQRTNDGLNFFNDIRVDNYIKIRNETYTEVEVFAFESYTRDLFYEVKGGDWLTAQNISTNLAISGIYDQTLKDFIQGYIDTYITDNY